MSFLSKLFRKSVPAGVYQGTQNFRDIAFLGQSPSCVIGRDSRTPQNGVASPEVNDLTTPISYFGVAGVDTTRNTVRAVQPGDTTIAGIVIQPYPFQGQAGTGLYGAQAFSNLTPSRAGAVLSLRRSGYIGVYCNGATQATRATPVYVWTAPSTGPHYQGGFEIAPSASAVVAPKASGNTGNGTLGTVSATNAGPGTYTVSFGSATAFSVTAPPNTPGGGAGGVGSAYSVGGLQFTATAGSTAFVSGDSFTITVTSQTMAYSSPTTFFTGPGEPNGAVELAFNI